ncbi:MAG: leucine-rich repeat domain-containing protein [Candidatus Lokiarchaeota archaeon]|nr:leucine-rich repeat domain-containing protein [Candidatus Lokiarchaeota archaeon]
MLELNNNNIVKLPKSIGSLGSLEYLWLEDNQIQTLPEEVFNLPALKFVTIRNNPLKNISEVEKRFLELGVKFRG